VDCEDRVNPDATSHESIGTHRPRLFSSHVALPNRTLPLILGLILFICLTACEQGLYQDQYGEFHGTGSRVYAYDSGTPMRVDVYASGRLTKSTWLKPNGDLIAETLWDKDGNGLDYFLNEQGHVTSKAEVVANTYHGKRWYYDEHGNVMRIVNYVDGVPEE
jgi:hypothetical protein